jgi:hypothetical protein
VRSQIKARLTELLSVATGVPVFRAFPPSVPDELIWLASTTGGLEYLVMGSNLPRDDKFSVVVVCMSFKPGDTPEQAEDRVEQIASAVVITLADNVRLDDEFADEFTVFDAVVTSIDGPDAMPGPDGEGWDAFVRLSIDIHLRITREI